MSDFLTKDLKAINAKNSEFNSENMKSMVLIKVYFGDGERYQEVSNSELRELGSDNRTELADTIRAELAAIGL